MIVVSPVAMGDRRRRAGGHGRWPAILFLVLLAGVPLCAAPAPALATFQSGPGRFEVTAMDAAAAKTVQVQEHGDLTHDLDLYAIR